MRLRIVRELTSEEVEERIRNFENKFGVEFEKFEELYHREKLESHSMRAYSEWAELVNSYKGYLEGGELDYTVEEVDDLKPEEAAMLTPKRMELLYQLATLRVDSINDLAKKVKRNVKNVHQDLGVLRRFGFVKLGKRKGRALAPETLVKEITFLVR